MLSPGTEIGSYRILNPLGNQGAMSTVYLGKDTRLDRLVVLKHLNRLQQDSDYIHQEGRILAKLKHPNIISIYDLVEYDGSVFLVMEYAPGENLRGFVKKRGHALDYNTVARLGVTLSSALEYLHRQNPPVIHRDVKPDNIFLRENDFEALLGDFGIVAIDGLPYQRNAFGTPPYVAPEQYTGEACSRSDAYSLAATLYFALTGKDPSPSPDEFLDQIEDSWRNKLILRGMCDLLRRSAQPSSADRYGASEMFHHSGLLIGDHEILDQDIINNVVRPIEIYDWEYVGRRLITEAEGPDGKYVAKFLKNVRENEVSRRLKSYELQIIKRGKGIRKFINLLRPQIEGINSSEEIVHVDLYAFDTEVIITYITNNIFRFTDRGEVRVLVK